jgi:hypothetical protein
MRLLRITLGTALLSVVATGFALAELPETSDAPELTEADINVDEMVFCAAVKDRNPVGVADTFPADIYSLCCFTTITGVKDTTVIRHRWHWGGKPLADVELPVRSAHWRTWSRKRMLPGWKGEWRVDIIAADSAVIESKRFVLK